MINLVQIIHKMMRMFMLKLSRSVLCTLLAALLMCAAVVSAGAYSELDDDYWYTITDESGESVDEGYLWPYEGSEPSVLSEYSYGLTPGIYTVSVMNETTGEDCASTEWIFASEDADACTDILVSYDTATGELIVENLGNSETLESMYTYTVTDSNGKVFDSGYLSYDYFEKDYPFYTYVSALAQDTYTITVTDAETEQECASVEWTYSDDLPDYYQDILINYNSQLNDIKIEKIDDSYYIDPANFRYSYSIKDSDGVEVDSDCLWYDEEQTDYPYANISGALEQGSYTVEIIDNTDESVVASTVFSFTSSDYYEYGFVYILYNPDTNEIIVDTPDDPDTENLVMLFVENADTEELVFTDLMDQYDEDGDVFYSLVSDLGAGNYNFYVVSDGGYVTQTSWECVPADGKSADVEVFFTISSDEIVVSALEDEDITEPTDPTDSEDKTEPTKDTKPTEQNSTSSNGATKDTASGGAVQTGGNSYAAVMLVLLSAACVFVLFARRKSELNK